MPRSDNVEITFALDITKSMLEKSWLKKAGKANCTAAVKMLIAKKGLC